MEVRVPAKATQTGVWLFSIQKRMLDSLRRGKKPPLSQSEIVRRAIEFYYEHHKKKLKS